MFHNALGQRMAFLANREIERIFRFVSTRGSGNLVAGGITRKQSVQRSYVMEAVLRSLTNSKR